MSNKQTLMTELIEHSVQFGHQTWRWNPKMAAYIWGKKDGIHLIDVSKTAFQIEKAAKFLEEVAAQGMPILWCGTKKAAQPAMTAVLKETGCPTVAHRWIGGTLTNYTQVRKSVAKLLHLEDIVAKNDPAQSHYTKKELAVFQKLIERINNNVGGIRKLTWPIGALVVVDVIKEHVAINEARELGIPIVAFVDTNGDPSDINYVIPSNDDSPRAIEYIAKKFIQAIKDGKARATTTVVDESVTLADGSLEKMLADALGGEDSEGARTAGAAKGRGPVRKPTTQQRPVRKKQ